MILKYKGVNQTVDYETKEQRNRFLGMLLVTLGANLLVNILAENGFIRPDNGVHRAGNDF